jgi:signal transduction histidine kinase
MVMPNAHADNINPIQFLKKLNTTKDTTGLYHNLFELEINFDHYNRPELITELLKSRQFAEDLNAIQLSQIYFIIKKYYDANGNKAMSFEYALKIYKLLIKIKKDENLLWILIDLGNIFYSEEDYENAISFYKKAENIAFSEKRYHPLAVIYLNYGLIYSKVGNDRDALNAFEVSNSYRFKSPNIKMIADNYVKMSEIYLKLENQDSCLFYLEKANYFYENKGIYTTVLVEIPCMIDLTYAKYYLFKKDYTSAIESVQKAKKYSKEKMLIGAFIADNILEAQIFLAQNKTDEAIAVLNGLLTFLEKNNIQAERIQIYKFLGSIYSKKGNYKKANEAYSNYMMLEKVWDNSNIKSKLNLIRSVSEMYESDEKIQESKEKLKIERMNYQLNVDEKNTSIIIIAVSAVSFFVFFVLFLTQRNSKRRLKYLHQKMVDQNLEIGQNSRELEKSNYLKDKLFSIIAHDLRNPLNRMLVELAILKKSIQSDPQIRQMEVTLKETIELFEGLLQWSKLDGKKNIYIPTKINLSDCFNKTLKYYESEIKYSQIEVQVDLQVNYVSADLNIIQTLFKNLISNGILYATKSEGRRIIEIKSKQINPKIVEIYISNSGPQFSEELISEFYIQDDNIISKSTGLGLSICKLLSKLCGWKIDIGNIEGNAGAFLTIEIPYAENQKENGSLTMNELVIPSQFKGVLSEFKNHRFYQISQIRLLLKKFNSIEDENIKFWLKQVNLAVDEGNEELYLKLLILLNI